MWKVSNIEVNTQFPSLCKSLFLIKYIYINLYINRVIKEEIFSKRTFVMSESAQGSVGTGTQEGGN